jgi:hypothetical protein
MMEIKTNMSLKSEMYERKVATMQRETSTLVVSLRKFTLCTEYGSSIHVRNKLLQTVHSRYEMKKEK